MCGIIGAVATTPISQDIYDALTIIQHRGQDAAGILTSDGRRIYLRKANGLVREALQKNHVQRLQGNTGLGHVRYPTAGSQSPAESQPFYVNSPYGLSIVHNGNLTNSASLAEDLIRTDLRHLNTDSDTEVLLNVFAHELQRTGSSQLAPEQLFLALRNVYRRVRGAYSAIALITGYGIVAFRDPYGIRPLIYGRRETSLGVDYMVASESIALDALGYKVVEDVKPGEAIYIDQQGQFYKEQCVAPIEHTPCLFEYVYLARPDSVLDHVSVYQARIKMGEKLGQKILKERPSHDIDVVIPIPDTSRTVALPLAQQLKIPYSEGFVKNRYIGRTFIMPAQELRRSSVRMKLNAMKSEFAGKNVLLVDDSIVRGTTSKEIIQMARDAGARRVYFASAAPPVRYPNVYGIDMPNAKELVAHNHTIAEIEKIIGADWLIYQDLKDLYAAINETVPDKYTFRRFEDAVFTGDYLTGDIDQNYLRNLAEMRTEQAKMKQSITES
ncbi:MAG: amidophosphoribosyltransferase [Proteobacteria bacterium]|nr:amidophosphoribosyltransferase [Pseudomonadota bacterium]